MKIAAINCSHVGNKAGQTIYNLAIHKIGNYHRRLGDEVYVGPWRPMILQDYDKFYFSVIFTWDIPEMIRQVNMVRDWGKRWKLAGRQPPSCINTYTGKRESSLTGVSMPGLSTSQGSTPSHSPAAVAPIGVPFAVFTK